MLAVFAEFERKVLRERVREKTWSTGRTRTGDVGSTGPSSDEADRSLGKQAALKGHLRREEAVDESRAQVRRIALEAVRLGW